MYSVEIIEIGQESLLLLQQIGRKTFLETFAQSNTEENMRAYLEEGFSLNKLTEELQKASSRFFLAKINNEVIGYLKLNFGASQTEIKDESALEIERIYVLKDFHGQKIGQRLYEKAIQLAVEMQMAYVWLGVWEENLRAIAFYRKNGFVEFDKHIFKLGDDEQIDIMMRLVL